MPREQYRRTALTAAGKRLQGLGKRPKPGKRAKRLSDEAWQEQTWYYYDVVIEYRYAAQWVGNSISKAVLRAEQDGKETSNEMARTVVGSLFNGPEGQVDLLRLLGIHLTVPGECYIIAVEDGDETKWSVRSASEVSSLGSGYQLGSGSEKEELPEDSLVLRIWRPHPRKRNEADSPSRAALPILQEIDKMTQYISAQGDSRLASAGILLVPNDISFPSVPILDESGDGFTEADGLAELLADVASQAIKDRSSPEALVPVILQADGEHLDKVKHIRMDSRLQTDAKAIREDAMNRLARGMDMPPEILLGVGDANHWSAWSIEEAAIKSHIEPLLELVLASLTEGYLRPALRELGMDEDEAATFSIGADTSKIRMRPNRSREAIELYDRLLLDPETVRTETGFDPENGLDDKELARAILIKLAQGSPTPELVSLAAEMLKAIPAGSIPGEDQTKAPETPSLLEHPRRDPPQRPEEASLAAEVIFFRAMERAGNKLKTRLKISPSGVDACDLYRHAILSEADIDAVLDDAWSLVPRFADRFHMDAGDLTSRLDQYARMLLRTRAEHDAEILERYLWGP